MRNSLLMYLVTFISLPLSALARPIDLEEIKYIKKQVELNQSFHSDLNKFVAEDRNCYARPDYLIMVYNLAKAENNLQRIHEGILSVEEDIQAGREESLTNHIPVICHAGAELKHSLKDLDLYSSNSRCTDPSPVRRYLNAWSRSTDFLSRLGCAD